LNKNYMLNTLPKVKNADQIKTNTKNSKDMKKFNAFTILCMLFFMASPVLLNAQVPENGLVFDGDDDFVTVSTTSRDELNPEENLTIETWVYLDSATAIVHRPYFVARLNSYALTLNASGNVQMYIRSDEPAWYSGAVGTTTIVPGRWYHIAGTYDGSVARVYVNGVQEDSETINQIIASSFANYRLGALNNFPNSFNLIGRMDEVRVWDVTRTQAQIQSTMNHTIPGSTAGLVGYWRFDESSGSTANDQSSHNNDGTLTNMSTPAAWQTSTAPMGNTSIFAVSSDIFETSECAVDADFRPSPEGDGGSNSMAVMQVNQSPNSFSGLYPDRASLYWEIWSEDPDFDNDFTQDVRFHYDGISGLPGESSLELFRRDNATSTWAAITGYTVVTDDGGSSTGTDGIGYVELTITETTPGDFSGQYILSWTNEPPVVSDIPDQSVAEGSVFATINLDDYVDDPDNLDSEITWTATGETDVTVTITDRVATITADDPEWNGTDVITFTAEDPEGETDTDDATFEVTRVNDPPVVGDILDQEVVEGLTFATINLDDFITDVDNDITTMTWTATGQTDLSVDITGRVATITLPDLNWNGSETITFQAEDPDAGTDSDDATFTVTPVNDPPVVDDIPDEEVAEGTAFATISLDDFVADVDDLDNTITWTATGALNLSVDITGRVATITPIDENWNGNETITFQAEDPDGETDTDQATFTVTPVNDPPVISDIPNQVVPEGTAFSTIILDDYVVDADDADNTLTWTVLIGPSNLNIDITNRVATITVNDPEWNGSQGITFIAEDPMGLQDSDVAQFTVTAFNDLPVVDDIPDQTVAEGQPFAPISLNDFVADADDPDSLITWTVQGDENVTVNIVDSVANISADDPEWNGSDTLIFTATDTSGAADTDTCIFTVTPINDAPTLSKAIPDFEVDAGNPFLFVLDPGTFTDVDPVDNLVLSASMSMGGSTPAWLSFDALSGTFSGTPADADKGIVEVIVTATDDSSASVADTFNIEVKSYVGISNPLDGLEINLYPNPNNGRFVIESDRFELKDVVLEIFNEKGQLIWNREIRDEIGTLHESVDLNNVADGLYLLRVRNNSGMINKRFIISR